MGIVAVLTIPVAVNKSINTINRTKVKKAMAAYDRALSKWYIDEGNISYAEDYKNAYVLDKDNELENYQIGSEEYKNKRSELTAARSERTAAVKNSYAEKFSKYFNIN